MSKQEERREIPAWRRPSPRLIALIVAAGLFMEQLDATVLSTALPSMAHDFHADPLHMSTALTAYLLSLAVFIPMSGQVADRFGSRTVFLGAILVFMGGSILCAQSTGLVTLVLARMVQGVGGALMVPVGRLVLLRAVPRNQLVMAMTWMTVPGMLGPVLGPPLGGLITTYLDWRWIFYINLPIGVLGFILVLIYIEEVKEDAPARFDWPGIVLSGSALSALMFGLEMTTRGVLGWQAGGALVLAGVGAALLYWWHARRTPQPVLDPALLRVPTYAISVISGSLFRIAFGSVPFLLPMFMQIGFGISAAESGFITFASAAGSALMKVTARPFLRVFGFRRALVWNGVVSGLLLALCGAFRPSWPLAAIYALLLVVGFISSLQFTAYNTIAYADLPTRMTSSGSSFYSTFQQFSLTLGIAVAAGVLSILVAIGGRTLPDLSDFTLTFVFMGAFSLASAPIAARLERNAGAEVSGQKLRA